MPPHTFEVHQDLNSDKNSPGWSRLNHVNPELHETTSHYGYCTKDSKHAVEPKRCHVIHIIELTSTTACAAASSSSTVNVPSSRHLVTPTDHLHCRQTALHCLPDCNQRNDKRDINNWYIWRGKKDHLLPNRTDVLPKVRKNLIRTFVRRK